MRLIPITLAAEVVPVAKAAVDKLRTVLPVMVFTPLEETIPLIIVEELNAAGTYALFKLAIILLVI